MARVELAVTPTRVDRLARMSEKLGVELLCKRDDLTGAALSGNKVRKLEYLCGDAMRLSADTLITCGGEQSNHCRATAVAAAQLGMKSILLLRTEDPANPPATTGNILLDRLVGAEIRWVSREQYRERARLFEEISAELREKGRRPYVIPEGGSNAIGARGYERCVDELAEQLPPGPVTIIHATGSGGTSAGLLLGVHKLGLPWRVVGVNVCDDRAYFVRVIGEIVEHKIPIDKIEIVDGYVGAGYAKSRPEEGEAIAELARTEGIIVDPVYTGKAFYGMTRELARDPKCFGARVVFLHTGGIFGHFR